MSFLCHYNDILHNSNYLKYKDISDNLCHMSLNLPFSNYSINFIALKFQLFLIAKFSFSIIWNSHYFFLPLQNETLTKLFMEKVVTKKKKLSLWERAKRMGKVLELAPGFSFDSDSKVKVYA